MNCRSFSVLFIGVSPRINLIPIELLPGSSCTLRLFDCLLAMVYFFVKFLCNKISFIHSFIRHNNSHGSPRRRGMDASLPHCHHLYRSSTIFCIQRCSVGTTHRYTRRQGKLWRLREGPKMWCLSSKRPWKPGRKGTQLGSNAGKMLRTKRRVI